MQAQRPQAKVFQLFPTAVTRVTRVLGAELVEQLQQRFVPMAEQRNVRSERLAHTAPLQPGDDPLLEQVSAAIVPHLSEFGALLLGQPLTWIVKELWVNVLSPGGQQSLHNHANSIVSGILYLTPSDPSANTVFVKALGGSHYVLDNMNERASAGPYNSDRWISPSPTPGDLLLFPSYLLHEVPCNRGARRVSLAFNAIPTQLDSWGYTLSLSR